MWRRRSAAQDGYGRKLNAQFLFEMMLKQGGDGLNMLGG